MDQKPTADGDKRNWRERLGIGSKELPKIAGEFSKADPAIPLGQGSKAGADRNTQPVVVARPAPMAPRVAGKAAASKPSSHQPARPAPMAAPRQTPAAPPQNPDQLAERLRSQRIAAERLAEQRVSNAKDKSEMPVAIAAKKPPVAQPPTIAATGLPPSTGRPAPVARQAPLGPARPKFSFAEGGTPAAAPPTGASPGSHNPAPARRDIRPQMAGQRPPPARPPGGPVPPLAPARPPLGGDRISPASHGVVRPTPPPLPRKPEATVFRSGGAPAQSYRPIDITPPGNPAAGAYVPSPAFPSQRPLPAQPMHPQLGPRSGPSIPMGGEPQLHGPSHMGPSHMGPGHMGPNHGAAIHAGPGHPGASHAGQGYVPPDGYLSQQQGPGHFDPLSRVPQRGDQFRTSIHDYEAEFADDIFEDAPAKPVRRASVNDYAQVYQQEDDVDYLPPRRRSSGPIIMLLLLVIALIAGVGGVWYYQKVAKVAVARQGGDAPPVVEMPEQPPKTTPPQASTQPGTAQPAATGRKQIYDRIVGDAEVPGGATVNTEEAPVPPAISPPAEGQVTPGQPAPGMSGQEQVPAPLPLPNPQSSPDTQGSLAPGEQQNSTVAAVQQPETQAALPPPDPPAAIPQPAGGSDKMVIEDTPQDEGDAVGAKPAASKVKAVKKKASSLGAKPVVLVPADPGSTQSAAEVPQTPVVLAEADTSQAVPSQIAPAPQPQAVVVQNPQAQASPSVIAQARKKKTVMSMFNGDEEAQPQAAPQQQAAIPPAPLPVTPVPMAPSVQQQARLQPAPTPAPQQATTGGSGYLLVLSSFSTEAEARSAYSRISSSQGAAISGLSPIINPVSVGGSTRYRLSLGPVASGQQAASICNTLANAGERDCVVRHR